MFDGQSFTSTTQTENDLLIPITHACTYQMDFFANPAFKAFFQQPTVPDDPFAFTAFDHIIHVALFDVGTDSFNG